MGSPRRSVTPPPRRPERRAWHPGRPWRAPGHLRRPAAGIGSPAGVEARAKTAMQPLDVSWLVRLRWAAALLFLLLALAARAVFHIPVPLLAVGVVWGLQVLTNVALGVRIRRHRAV